ncbi:hypothetical protein FWG95_03665 [Candidatus Saccharibacteria bacterium]|nr:hypothetical protein [Candidatus Saccharibacteria bacterium]
MRRIQNESGQIAIITVVIFMLLFSIVVVSFTRIMVAASHEAVSDELRARALAAAESGVEDAKRILTYCLGSGSSDSRCAPIINKSIDDQGCDTILSTNSILKDMGLTGDIESINGTNQVKVGNGGQYYMCLRASAISKDYTGEALVDSKSTLILLNTFCKITGHTCEPTPVSAIMIEWSSNSDPPTGDGQRTPKGGTDFPSMQAWNNPSTGNGAPATLRVEYVRVPQGNGSGFTVQDLTNNARAVTLRPSSNTGVVRNTNPTNPANNGCNMTETSPGYNCLNIDKFIPSIYPNDIASVPLQAVNCSGSGYPYRCSVMINRGTGGANFVTNNGETFYLRLQAIYWNTNLRITAYDTSGNKLLYKGGQPTIDVTGRAQDSFQRIEARVAPRDGSGDDDIWWPEYAIDSGGKVCKDISVVRDSGSDNCSYN